MSVFVCTSMLDMIEKPYKSKEKEHPQGCPFSYLVINASKPADLILFSIASALALTL